jgi:hypothetical protein
MKKYLPFVFPALAFVLVMFLAYRWYTLRIQRDGQISQVGEGIKIDDLTGQSILEVTGAKDYQKVEMSVAAADGMGELRYELSPEGKVNVSIMANLPELTSGVYQVWVKSTKGGEATKAITLQLNKAGYIGSLAIPQEALPVEVTVSKELTNDNQMEQVVLRGTISQVSAQ